MLSSLVGFFITFLACSAPSALAAALSGVVINKDQQPRSNGDPAATTEMFAPIPENEYSGGGGHISPVALKAIVVVSILSVLLLIALYLLRKPNVCFLCTQRRPVQPRHAPSLSMNTLKSMHTRDSSSTSATLIGRSDYSPAIPLTPPPKVVTTKLDVQRR